MDYCEYEFTYEYEFDSIFSRSDKSFLHKDFDMKIKSVVRSVFFAFSFLIVTVIAAATPITGGAVPAQAQSTWTQVWRDDFNGAVGSAPDGTKWGYDIGGGGW